MTFTIGNTTVETHGSVTHITNSNTSESIQVTIILGA